MRVDVVWGEEIPDPESGEEDLEEKVQQEG